MILSNNIFKKSIIAIILLFSIAFIINFSYLRKINIYEPVSISFPNLNVGQKKRINVYGLSILKRKLPFYYDNSSQSWKHFYCFQHSLYITINDTFKFTKPIINLTIGNNSMRLDSRDFIQIEKQTGTNGFQIYNKRQNGFNYLKMIRSVFYWTVTRKLIIWFLWVLFFPLFCFVLIKYRKRISSFIVKIFVSFKLLLIRFITFSEKKTIHTVETIRNFNKHIVGKIHFCHHTFVNFQERFVLSSKGKLLAFGFFLNALIKGISESKNYKRICRIILNIIAYLKLRVLKKKWLRTSLKIAFIIFLIINLLLGLIGISSILLTISFYILLWTIFKKIILLHLLAPKQKDNWKLLIAVLLISLLVSEFALKYVFKTNLNYSEKNNNFFNLSIYKRGVLINLHRKYIIKQKDIQLMINKPNTESIYSCQEFYYKYKYNSLGLRGKNIVKDSTLYTYMGLGDSFTEGLGTTQDSTWLSILEKNLNIKNKKIKVQCINGGVLGSDPFYEYILLERELIKYKPQTVIVSINETDIDDVVIRGGFERFNSDGGIRFKKAPWWEFFYQFSYIFRLFTNSIFHIDSYLLLSENQKEEQTKEALLKLKSCISVAFKNLSKHKGFKLVVILNPMLWELEQNKFSLQSLWDSFKNDTSFTTINLFNEIKEEKKRVKFNYRALYWQTDIHNNSKGYKLWADILNRKM